MICNVLQASMWIPLAAWQEAPPKLHSRCKVYTPLGTGLNLRTCAVGRGAARQRDALHAWNHSLLHTLL